ncbi:TonB family protein [Porphyrobacter sp. YT40]|uniref:TonB family protein n=1 Tax=Porphyrobacter sp. YT40 TaxID=2547601 RepID=UPI0015E88DF1|nr:TonB family protein [Porphyrobacter sp. YT40]
MTYASANRRPNPAAMVGALGIPGAFGALLVVGLAVTVVTVPEKPRPEARDIPDFPLPPPPPPKPDTPRERDTPTSGPTTTPDNPTLPTPDLPTDWSGWDAPADPFPGTGDSGAGTGATGDSLPDPGPSASPFDPVGAKPKGNPGRWVTNEDYRTRWVREELTGTARFTLAISASGKVTGCTITRSTGHAALDTATCELVTKRARFEAARDGMGKAVAGSYSGSITWQIP